MSEDTMNPEDLEVDPIDPIEVEPVPAHLPPVLDWWLGTSEAVELGTRALTRLGVMREGKPVRAAVSTLQKKWGHTPTGSLNRDQWTRLLHEGI